MRIQKEQEPKENIKKEKRRTKKDETVFSDTPPKKERT